MLRDKEQRSEEQARAGGWRSGESGPQSVWDRRIESFRPKASSGYRSCGGRDGVVPYSQGQTEGRINKLKFVKRSMYGRGRFELLRQRVLYAPAA
jgi:hypothetical protein